MAQEGASTLHPSPILETRWKPFVHGPIKVNFDVAVPGTNYVVLGGVARDSVGDVVVSTCLRVLGNFEADVAEALAMRHALSTSMESGFRKVCLETDCIRLYSHLSKGYAPHTAFGLVVNDILHLARRWVSCSFSFVKRSGNCVAHKLAKLSLSFHDLRVWMEEVPSDVFSAVVDDLHFLSE
ncbi:uncharacterized protein LOC110704108 [Chenopodium quinoa]|nr:uncharacterized protein LOC110704108 [Chenopodium quinoa]